MKSFHKDVRKIIYGKLTNIERELLLVAHDPNYSIDFNSSFTMYCAIRRYSELLEWAESRESPWRVKYYVPAYGKKGYAGYLKCYCDDDPHIHIGPRMFSCIEYWDNTSTRFIVTRIDNPKSSAQ
jgi:hypothetical protein